MNSGESFFGSVEDHAADWLARRDVGLTPAQSAEFERWLSADPRHRAAVRELDDAWFLIAQPRATGHADRVLTDLAQRAKLRRDRCVKHVTWAASGLAAAAAITLSFWLPTRRAPPHVDTPIITITPHPERQILADGSVVELNAGAEILVAFTPERRDIQLLRGEAHFAVTKDAARPFVVTAGGIETRAVGTAFSVRFAERDVRVLVTEGRVAVGSPALASSRAIAPVLVAAGTRVTVPLTATTPAAQPESVTPAEVAQALAWRTQRVEFSGTSLAKAVALFNRQNRLQLALADTTIGSLRVSGVFWTDDPEGFARLIEPVFSLRTRSIGTDRIEIGR